MQQRVDSSVGLTTSRQTKQITTPPSPPPSPPPPRQRDYGGHLEDLRREKTDLLDSLSEVRICHRNCHCHNMKYSNTCMYKVPYDTSSAYEDEIVCCILCVCYYTRAFVPSSLRRGCDRFCRADIMPVHGVEVKLVSQREVERRSSSFQIWWHALLVGHSGVG